MNEYKSLIVHTVQPQTHSVVVRANCVRLKVHLEPIQDMFYLVHVALNILGLWSPINWHLLMWKKRLTAEVSTVLQENCKKNKIKASYRTETVHCMAFPFQVPVLFVDVGALESWLSDQGQSSQNQKGNEPDPRAPLPQASTYLWFARERGWL